MNYCYLMKQAATSQECVQATTHRYTVIKYGQNLQHYSKALDSWSKGFGLEPGRVYFNCYFLNRNGGGCGGGILVIRGVSS